MASNLVSITRRGFGQTMRKDNWWVAPVLTFIGLGAFVVYSTWAAFQGDHYTFGNYLSPFYSPEIFGNSPHAMFGAKPAWIPAWLPFSPALLILWAPGGFRFTCYYYRGAYYKCGPTLPHVRSGEPRHSYRGERKFHDLTKYPSLFSLSGVVLFAVSSSTRGSDVVHQSGWQGHFGVGVGTIILTANVFALVLTR